MKQLNGAKGLHVKRRTLVTKRSKTRTCARGKAQPEMQNLKVEQDEAKSDRYGTTEERTEQEATE